MQMRKLGNLDVPALGYDCMGLTGAYGAGLSRPDGIAMIHAAFERGVTLFDTAEAYGPFTKERSAPRRRSILRIFEASRRASHLRRGSTT